MSTQQLLLIAAGALLVFWMLGAHNRLVALRNEIIAAWAQVDEPLQRRGAVLQPLLGALRELFADEHVALDALQSALAQVQTAADALRQRPALAQRAAALKSAEAALQAALSRLLALLEQRSRPAAGDELLPKLAALRDTAQRLVFARQLFNDAVGRYNEAAHQFPTRLVSRLFGFGAAGTL